MNGYQAVSQTECTKQIKRLRGYDTKLVKVSKKSYRIYVLADEGGAK